MRAKNGGMKQILCAVIAGAGGVMACASLAAQPPAASLPRLGKADAAASETSTLPPPPVAPKGKQAVKYYGRLTEKRQTPQGDIIALTNAVWFRSKDAYLTTEKALWNDRTKIASSPVKLKIETQDATITGNTGAAFFNTKDAQIRGQIVMVIRPRPEDANAPAGSARRQFDSPATITCEKLDYNWRSGKGVLTDKLVVTQKKGVVTADRLLIDTKKQTIILTENVVYKGANGDEANYKQVTLNYREGDEKPFIGIDGGGTSYVDQDEDVAAPEAASKPTPPAPQNP